MPEIRICKDCGKSFELCGGERDFFLSKRLQLPKRCKPCRKAKSKGMLEPKAIVGRWRFVPLSLACFLKGGFRPLCATPQQRNCRQAGLLTISTECTVGSSADTGEIEKRGSFSPSSKNLSLRIYFTHLWSPCRRPLGARQKNLVCS